MKDPLGDEYRNWENQQFVMTTGGCGGPLVYVCAVFLFLHASSHPMFNCSKPNSDIWGQATSARCPCQTISTAVKTRPVLWVHVPKTGSSFANTVFRVACKKLPLWAFIRINSNVSTGSVGRLVPYFSKCFHKEIKKCPLEGGASRNTAHHPLANTAFDPEHVAYVTMLREPSSRIVAGFHHNLHDCHNCTKKNTTLSEYAAATAGMYTDYFAGTDSVDAAVKRIQQFAFVGLMEHWDLSICLYHHLFGGPVPIESEFANLRPGKYKHSKKGRDAAAKEIAQLRKSLPAHLGERLITDNMVYAAGVAKFWSDIRRYRLSCAHGPT